MRGEQEDTHIIVMHKIQPMSNASIPLFLLRDLAIINGERVVKYQQIKRTGEKLELDMAGILSDMIQQSVVYQQELTDKISQLDGISMHAKKPGEVYHLWEEEQVMPEGRGRLQFLTFCEKEEQALQRAYRTVLEHVQAHEDIQFLLERHESDIDYELDHLARYRNAL